MAIAGEFGNYDALGLAQLIRDREVSAAGGDGSGDRENRDRQSGAQFHLGEML